MSFTSRFVDCAFVVAVVIVADVSVEADPPSTGAEFGAPLPGLDPAEIVLFESGKETFVVENDAAEGLGPVFNDVSCVACHNEPAAGGGSTRLETRIGTITGGAFDPLTDLGGPLLQSRGIGAAREGRRNECYFVGEITPAQATIVAQRLSSPLFGLGLVEAVEDSTILRLAGRQALRSPRTAGRPNLVRSSTEGRTRVGRFGWKAQVATLLDFAGDAYVNEIGISTPPFPDENCPQGDCSLLECDPVPGPDDDEEDVAALADFMRLLAPPPRGRITPEVLAGQGVFTAAGCGDCHVPTLVTGPSPVAALDRVPFRPFSDFLLHDIGSGDDVTQDLATGELIRTAPLWGLRARDTFLHDGRAGSVEEAILTHDHQARPARDRFLALPPGGRRALMAFLDSL